MSGRRFELLRMLLLLAPLSAGCGGDAPQPSEASATTSATAPSASNDGATAGSAADAPQAADIDVDALLAQAEQHLQLRQGNEALQLLNQAIEAAPERADVYVRRAELLTAADYKAQAVADLTKAIELDPRNARACNTRGYLRMALKEFDAAIEDFSTAVSIDLKYPQPYNNRGLVRISLGEPDKALLDFDAALRIDPDYIDAHNNRGYTLTLLNRHDDAVAALTHAIELDPKYVNAWNNRGLAHKSAGRFDEAVADFNHAIELQPSNTKYYLHRSEALAELGRDAESKADIEHVVWLERLAVADKRVASTGEIPSSWLARAEHMRAGKRYDAALSDVVRAIQLLGPGTPEACDAYVLQARILLEQGHIERAIEAANQALQCRPEQQAYSVRGDAHYQLQNFERAVDDYQQARRLDPMVQQAFTLHAEQLEAKGDIQQAGYFREQASRMSFESRPAAASESAAPLPFPVDVTQPVDDSAEAPKESVSGTQAVAEEPADSVER
ncbi:MAG: tetratricopeptide repeat protein [Planctomycetaceae bacterium]|nr:tetratricopeptide repeat protein [Planctomycetaceae bacterium]